MPTDARILLLAFIVAAQLSSPLAAEPPLDDSCIVGHRPAATLLIPYFEVDLDDPNGKTLFLSINNASPDPTLARVVLWTDCHLPVFSFDVFLETSDMATINLRQLIVDGFIVETAPDGTDLQDFPGCTSPLTNPILDDAALADLQAKLTGQPSPNDGLCYGSERPENRIAAGFLTIDVLNDCSSTIRFPDDAGYFIAGGNGLASNDNVLWGDYYWIDPAENFAQGFEAVGIVANAGRFDGTNIRSFYQVTDDERDDRLPLSSKLRTRYLNGGAFDGSTQFMIWAQRSPELQPFTCGEAAGACPAAADLQLEMTFFDELATQTGSSTFTPPAFVGRYAVEDLGAGANFGFLDLNSKGLGPPVGPPPLLEQRQAWMVQTSSALGRFSVGLAATRLDDLCFVGDQGE